MCMKKIWSFALLILVFWAIGMCTAEVPNLLGNWNGLANGLYAGEDGSSKPIENWTLNMIIGEQKDRLFAGNMTYMGENGTQIVEGVTGAIGLDNKTLYIAEYKEGYDIGTIISDDEIELIYLQDGKKGETEIDRLHRIKA
jgi:hypothetical protein